MTFDLTDLQLLGINKLIDVVAERQCKDFGNILSEVKSDGTLKSILLI